VSWTVWILIETPETDEIIVAEQLDLFARFFHLNVFGCQGMDTENLKDTLIPREVILSRYRQHTWLSIFISSSVGDMTSNHHVAVSVSGSPFPLFI